MESKSKIIIGAGVVIALSAVALIVLKKIKSRKSYTMPITPITPIGDNASDDGASNPRETPSWTPAASAQAIYDSMKGWQTDEDLFFNTSDVLSSEQRKKVKDYFNDNLGDGDDLCEWIEGDFSGGQEDRALALFGYPTGAFYSNCG